VAVIDTNKAYDFDADALRDKYRGKIYENLGHPSTRYGLHDVGSIAYAFQNIRNNLGISYIRRCQ
jgi:hypothetical protein